MAEAPLLLTKIEPPEPRPGHVPRSESRRRGCARVCTGA